MSNYVCSEDDPEKSPWRMAGAMKVGRSYLASAILDEWKFSADGAGDRMIYVVAGCLSESTSTAEVYNTRTKEWTTIADTLGKRDSLGLAELDGELYAVGGYDNLQNRYLKTVER